MLPRIRLTRPLPCRFPLGFAVALSFGLIAAPAFAQEKDLPTGAEILDKQVAQMGGAEAFGKLNNLKMSGRMEVVGTGQTGTIDAFQKAPAHLRRVVSMAGAETILGTDGSIAWEIGPSGARLLDGIEKAQLIRDATFNPELNWRDLYTKAESKGVEKVAGADCYVVELTPKEGEPETRYFNTETGALMQARLTVASAFGPLPIEMRMTDYREVDGIKAPHVVDIDLGGASIKTTFNTLDYNVTIPDDTFAIPAEIKKLADK